MLKISKDELNNGTIRLTIESYNGINNQQIDIFNESKWIPGLKNIDGFNTLIFNKGKKSISKQLRLLKKTNSELIYTSDNPDISIDLKINLNEHLHFEYKLNFKKKFKFSSLIAKYNILMGKNPDFTWVPHLRPKMDQVIPAHVFRSPVMIYNKSDISIVIVPDLKLLGDYRPIQSIMDFNLRPNIDNEPYFYYGFGNYKPVSHILFKHNPKKMVKIKPGHTLTFGYNILVFKVKSILELLKKVNKFLWNMYGKNLLYDDFAPQVVPFDINVKEGIAAILDRHKCWADFKINTQDCGGFFQNSWLGKSKRKYKFITHKNIEKHRGENISQIAGQESIWGKIVMHFSNSLFWIKLFDKLTRNLPIIKRTAEIWNNAWFLNIRSGYGLRYFGEFWGDKDLIKKGTQILNTILNLTRIKGVFPSVIFPPQEHDNNIITINGLKAFIPSNDFHLVDTCLTMYWALKYYQDFEQNQEIVIKSAELIDLLEDIQLPNGAIPAYINFQEDNKTPIIKDLLIDSASSGAPLMFIMEYYKVTNDPRCIVIAEKIASYLEKNIIPEDKWHDFEIFFSCTHLPFDFYDYNTKSHPMNTLCIYWNAAGLISLFRFTKNKKFLDLGERVLGVLSLFQQVWDMPYISFNTFGGFGSQNEDAELSDARQALFVRIFLEYYLETGKTEYMERGIAALRASWAMQLLKEYKEQCPGNIKGINTIDGVDKGCILENYGHSGHDFRVPGYVMLDWGVGTSISTTAYVKKHFGDIFIDFERKIVFGIDGVLVLGYKFDKTQLNIDFKIISGKTYVLIKGRAPVEPNYKIILNGKSIGKKDKKTLISGFKLDVK
ncbi:MAG: hypothetical protein ACTSQO_11655 [Candidatus Helarchaeota archaeon]